MKFSERVGARPQKTELDKEGISSELQNTLWTVVYDMILNKLSNWERDITKTGYTPLANYYRHIWIYVLKLPVDALSMYSNGAVDKPTAYRKLRKWYFGARWYDVFDFIESCKEAHIDFAPICNRFLEKELSAYRFVAGELVDFNSEGEVAEVESAIAATHGDLITVHTHIKQALKLYGDIKNPDYRNSIKESISAVEALCRIITSDDKATLGKALKEIEIKHDIPKVLHQAFTKLYGYVSDNGGIRHALTKDDVLVDQEEARFMLATCTAFVNYLIAKMQD